LTLPQHNTPIDEYHDKIAQGRMPGITHIHKFGRSSLVGVTESVIWDHGGSYTFLEAAEYISVVSDDADDNPLSTGAHTIMVFGLDDNYDVISEILTLDGLTPVITVNKYLRFNRMFIALSGTNSPIADANIGTITATSVTTAAIQAKILPRNGQTLMLVWTVPRAHSARIVTLQGSAGDGKAALIKFKARNSPPPEGAFSIKYILDLFQGNFFYALRASSVYPEKTDFVVTASDGAPAIDVAISMGIHIFDTAVVAVNPA
jgi:hypothetical protein